MKLRFDYEPSSRGNDRSGWSVSLVAQNGAEHHLGWLADNQATRKLVDKYEGATLAPRKSYHER